MAFTTTQISGTPSTVHYVFAPDGKLLAEHDGATGALIREYVWIDDMPLAFVVGSVAAPLYYYVHTGQIDEPLMVTDAAKAKVWDAAVDPWGRPTMLSTATQALNLRLPGQWYQGESALHQNWMRDYDPVLGRYIEADPIGIMAGQSIYQYVSANPLNAFDAMGLKVELRCRPVGDFYNPDPVGRIAGFMGGEHCFVVIECKDKVGTYVIPNTIISYLSRVSVSINHSLRNSDDGYSEAGVYRTLNVIPSSEGNCETCKFEKCVPGEARLLQVQNYTIRGYNPLFGPNSNSFARRLIEFCRGRVEGDGPPTGWGSSNEAGF